MEKLEAPEKLEGPEKIEYDRKYKKFRFSFKKHFLSKENYLRIYVSDPLLRDIVEVHLLNKEAPKVPNDELVRRAEAEKWSEQDWWQKARTDFRAEANAGAWGEPEAYAINPVPDQAHSWSSSASSCSACDPGYVVG